MLSRHVGLSRNHGPAKSLLQKINGRPRSDSEGTRPLQTPNCSTRAYKDDMLEDLDNAPPPEASSDEDDFNASSPAAPGGDLARPPSKKPLEDISDSDEDDETYHRKRNADMAKTVFSTNNRNSKTGSRTVAKSGPARLQFTKDSSSGPSPRPSHLIDDTGFVRTQSQKSSSRIRKPNKKMASTLRRSYSTKERPRDVKRKTEAQHVEDASPINSRLKVHKVESSPEPTSPTRPFKRRAAVLDSPGHSPEKITLRKKQIDRDSSPEAPIFRRPKMLDDDCESTGSLDSLAGKPSRPQISRLPKGLSNDLDSLSPTGSTDEGLDPFEESIVDNSLLDDDLLEGNDLTQDDIARCPMCRAEVDPELLRKHTGVSRMSIRQQTAFCRLHQRKEASKTGTYPEVDWSTMDRRLEEHRIFLKKILEGRQESHYAEKFQDKLKDKTQRTLFKSGESLTPGYFGPRGLRLMTDFIIRDLGDVLRRRAVEDMLVSARGHTRYVQSVLVPELAVCLIMEDLSVSATKARAVLEESKAVGDLLNEDTGDVVVETVSDDEL